MIIVTAEEREAMANRCRKHIEWLSKFAFNRYNHRESVQEELNIYQIALASLETKPKAWFTDDAENDRSATTYDAAMAERWRNKPWFVGELYDAPPVPVMQPVKLPGISKLIHAMGCTPAVRDVELWNSAILQCAEAIRAAGGSVKE